jgi:prolyl-tRNA synthetase
MVLAMTHEEVVADLCKSEISSYRDLPRLVYQVQVKFRDDPRPRAGLVRTREFTMKDAYSLDADEAGLDRQYRALYRAYFNVFNRAALPVIAVGSDVGMMGGSLAHEFMYLTPIGEDTLVLCDHCGYAANRQIASVRKPEPSGPDALPIRKVATPGAATIEDLAAFLGIPADQTAKALFMAAEREQADGSFLVEPIVAIVRGDMELNETKLANAVKAADLRPMTEEEIAKIGAVAGYGSPIGVTGATIVIDDSSRARPTWSPAPTRPISTTSTPTTGATTPPTWSPTSPPPATARPASRAAPRCAPRVESRWATPSSWAPATAPPSAPAISTLTASNARS